MIFSTAIVGGDNMSYTDDKLTELTKAVDEHIESCKKLNKALNDFDEALKEIALKFDKTVSNM